MGISVSAATLAVSPDCKLCGMCLYGCPYGYIFSSADVVAQLRSRDGFTYLGGLKAQRLVSRGDGADVTVTQGDGTSTTLSADRIFVAAGVLGGAISFGHHIWDHAAGVALVRAAGGVVTDLSGLSWTAESKSALAAAPGIHEQILELVAAAGSPADY